MDDNKIYCINCRYCDYESVHVAPLTGYCFNYCRRPSQIIGTKTIPASTIEPEKIVEIYEDNFITCQCENKNNNCKHFKEKLG